MRKIYFMMLLMAALLCVPTGVEAETQVVLSEDFESNSLETNGWTKQSCHSKTGIETTASHSTSRSFKFNYSTNPPQYLISKELSVPAGATAEEKAEIIKSNAKKQRDQSAENLSEMIDKMLVEHPQETLNVLALCCFLEPDHVDDHTVDEYFECILELIQSKSVMNFFTLLAQLNQRNG